MFYAKFVKVTFYYKYNKKKSDEIEVSAADFKPIVNRIATKSGILVIKDTKIDLTMVDKIVLEFFTDLAVQ